MELAARIEASLPEAYAIARAVTASEEDAEDAVGSAVVAVLSRPDRFDPARPFLPYFARVVVNSARGLHRSARRRREREEIAMVRTPGATEGSRLERRETAAAVRTALEALPVDERAAVLITHLGGLSQADAGEILGLPTRTVSRRVGSALEKLRRMLTRAGFAGLALPALLADAIRRPVPGRLSARVHALSRSTQAAAPTSSASVTATKGGMAMKMIAGVLAASAVAAGVAVISGGGGGEPLPAEGPPVKRGHKDFEYTTVGGIFIEHVAFSGNYGHLDGPARGGTIRTIWGLDCDAAGNVYVFDPVAAAVRAVRKRDKRIFTLSGNRYTTYGSPQKQGPAHTLRLGGSDQQLGIAMTHFVAVGDPMDGDGSLYVSDHDGGVVVRLYRNKEKENAWWYELVAGLGKQKPAPGLAGTDVKLLIPRVAISPEGRVGFAAGRKSAQFFWLENGKLVPAYDNAYIEGKVGDTFQCHGIDAEGNFVGTTGEYNKAKPFIVVVSKDGKTVRKITPSYPPMWALRPDRKKPGRWFFRSCDDYKIQYVNPESKSFRLMRGGTWAPLTDKKGNTGANVALNYAWGNAMADGRYAGCSRGNSPLFAITFLDGGR